MSEVSGIDKLIELSRFYGANSEYTLAGGGNTSLKNDETLIVKASGSSLAEAAADSFVKMNRKALKKIWDKTYPVSNDEREKEVLFDLMAARKEAAEDKRPSVEALLHDIIPFSYVVHLHPALVNGLCCSRNGEAASKEIFGSEALWIPSINPGYMLSRLVKTALAEYYEIYKKNAPVILLQNHGIFAGADTADGIKSVYDDVMEKISAKIKRKPDFTDEVYDNTFSNDHKISSVPPCLCVKSFSSKPSYKEIMQMLKEFSGYSAFMNNREISSFIKDRNSFYPVSSAFTPDHIVYSGSDPFYTEVNTPEAIRDEWDRHTQKTGKHPKITAVKDIGIFSASATEKAAFFALDLFKDTVKVAVYTESFGGPLFMTKEKIDFINNWEVERFRSVVSTK